MKAGKRAQETIKISTKHISFIPVIPHSWSLYPF
jgi:hypothetical protein